MDPVFGLLLVALAPGAFWLWYFVRQDRFEPEPPGLILLVFLGGVLAVFPAGILEDVFGVLLGEDAIAVLIAPVVEEVAKCAVVLLTAYRTAEFDEPMDGIVYAVAAAMGFATLENVLYVFSSLEEGITPALGTGLARAFLSVPGHALFALPWGYSLGIARFRPRAALHAILLPGLFTAIAFHTLYNFLLSDAIGVALLILVLVPLMWWIGRDRIARALRQEPQ